jgi:hypothetical protein
MNKMSMGNSSGNSGLNNYGVAEATSRSRIQSDIDLIKSMTSQVEATSNRIVAHARALGYIEPPSDAKTGANPQAVITTMADALRALDAAINHCSGSLNVFD